jgi:hypothetical protein
MSNLINETNDLGLGELAGLGNLDDVQVENTTNEEAPKEKKEKKAKEVKPKFEVEDFGIDTKFTNQPAENMETYMKDWCYATDVTFAGNVRHSYTGLAELGGSIVQYGLVNRPTVVKPENDCVPTSTLESIEYQDAEISLNTPHENSVHGLDCHRRILSILRGMTVPIRVCVGTDENGDNVYEEVTFPENYRIPITYYAGKITNPLERKIIQNTFNKVQEISDFDRLMLALEAMCEFNVAKGKFVKPSQALAKLGGADAMKLKEGSGNYMTGIGKVLRFMFGGVPPQNPSDFNTVLNDTQKTFLKLVENNFVGASTLINKVLNVTYAGAAKGADYVWAVTLEEMVEYMLSVIKADNRKLEDVQTGNPMISSTMLLTWIKGRTDIENAALAAENAATKAANAPAKDANEPVTEGSDLTQGEIPQDSGMSALSALDTIKDTENTPILNIFAEMLKKHQEFGVINGTPMPKQFEVFLQNLSDIESGEKVIGDNFVFFKQLELGLDISESLVNDEDNYDLLPELGDLENMDF